MTTSQDMKTHLNRLAIFPLGGVTFFPNTPLPLMVFEPRYLKLVEDAISSSRPLCVPMVEEGASKDPVPAVRSVAGAGFIEHSRALPDGRVLIQLAGLARVRLIEELPQQEAYREFRAALVDESRGDEAEGAIQRQLLRSVLMSLRSASPELCGKLTSLTQNAADCGELADVLGNAIVDEPASRQALLEELDPVVRLKKVVDQLGSILAQMAGSPDPSVLN